jgi:hypothetical protein
MALYDTTSQRFPRTDLMNVASTNSVGPLGWENRSVSRPIIIHNNINTATNRHSSMFLVRLELCSSDRRQRTPQTV